MSVSHSNAQTTPKPHSHFKPKTVSKRTPQAEHTKVTKTKPHMLQAHLWRHLRCAAADKNAYQDASLTSGQNKTCRGAAVTTNGTRPSAPKGAHAHPLKALPFKLASHCCSSNTQALNCIDATCLCVRCTSLHTPLLIPPYFLWFAAPSRP